MPAPGNGNAQPAGNASPGSLLGTPSLLHASAPAAGRSSDAPQTVPPIEDRSPLQPFRPPSPKYDERAGGFFTPAPLGPQPLLRVAATVAAPGAVNPPHADLHTPDDGVAAALHVCVPGPPIQAAAAGAVAAAAARSDEAGSDDDIPSPKYDETTCFFTRPRSTDHRRRPRRPAPAADGPASAAALHPQPAPAPAAATPATPQRPGSHAQPVGSPAVQGLQAPPAASAAPSPALALLTPGNAFTHVRPHGSISQLSVPRPGAAAAAVPLSQAGFRTSVPGQGHQLTILSIEVLAATRGTLTPDPRHDELLAIAFAVWYDHEDVHNHEFDTRVFLNARHVDAAEAATGRLAGGLSGCQMDVCTDEKELLEAVIAAVVALDADVVVGFDVMRWSLGYLDARSRVLDMQPPLIRRIGRCPGFPGAASCPSPMVAAPPLWLHAAAPAVSALSPHLAGGPPTPGRPRLRRPLVGRRPSGAALEAMARAALDAQPATRRPCMCRGEGAVQRRVRGADGPQPPHERPSCAQHLEGDADGAQAAHLQLRGLLRRHPAHPCPGHPAPRPRRHARSSRQPRRPLTAAAFSIHGRSLQH